MFCTSIITVYLGLQSISAYGLVGIAVTRYISIRDPLLFNTRVTHGRALTAAIALWIILLVTSALLYFRLSPDGQPNFSLFSTRVMALGGGHTPLLLLIHVRCRRVSLGKSAGRIFVSTEAK